jgi:hypothetical protein
MLQNLLIFFFYKIIQSHIFLPMAAIVVVEIIPALRRWLLLLINDIIIQQIYIKKINHIKINYKIKIIYFKTEKSFQFFIDGNNDPSFFSNNCC